MLSFKTSLTREKFTLKSISKGKNDSIIALSNRVELSFEGEDSDAQPIILRTQNMHDCVRMTGRLVQAYNIGGPLLNRQVPFDWERAQEEITSTYEKEFNPDRWIAVYHDGRIIYRYGKVHPFFDLIERCEVQNDEGYDDSILLAENMFKQTGKAIDIEYDGNVALVVDYSQEKARNSIILRSPTRTTTFTFSVRPRSAQVPINFSQCLFIAAGFLEAVQLCFLVGTNTENLRTGALERGSESEKKTKKARKRILELGGEIASFEDLFSVNYRPERPEFKKMITEAERLAGEVFI